MPNLSIKQIVCGLVILLLVGLVFYCNHLSDRYKVLEMNFTALKESYDDKVSALTECSGATDALKAREDEITTRARAALDEAKKQAVVDYKASQSLLLRKPVQPVITPQNQSQYGGSDKDIQLKDYLATQQLMNEMIDSRSPR
jgi:hypothetical protein